MLEKYPIKSFSDLVKPSIKGKYIYILLLKKFISLFNGVCFIPFKWRTKYFQINNY